MEVYLQACKSCHSDLSPGLELSDYRSDPCEFLKMFCEIFQRDWLDTSTPPTGTPFWRQTILGSECAHSGIRSPTRMKNEPCSNNSINKPTYEDHLYQILMEDLHVEDNAQTCESIVPLGWSLRRRLEDLVLRALVARHASRLDVKIGRSPPAKQARMTSRGGVPAAADLFCVIQHLYTKVS